VLDDLRKYLTPARTIGPCLVLIALGVSGIYELTDYRWWAIAVAASVWEGWGRMEGAEEVRRQIVEELASQQTS
jgi:hypothetical protein